MADYDLVVYGGSPAGVGAAVTAARAGLRVLVAEPLGQIGGMVTGGLSRTDLGRPETVGGLFREFMGQVVSHYRDSFGEASQQVQDGRGGERFEPKVALSILEQMLTEAGVEVRLRRAISAARCDRGELRSVTFSSPKG
jgi:flavin-dependent dehydrogenase